MRGLISGVFLTIAMTHLLTGEGGAAPAQKPTKQTESKGKIEQPKLAPVFSPSIQDAPIMLQPQRLVPLQQKGEGNTVNNGPAFSNTVVDCSLPVSQVGSLTFDGALAVIRNGCVEVREPYLPPATTPLLGGRIIKLDDAGTADGAWRKMSGLVVFTTGSMLSQLKSDAQSPVADNSGDLIFRKEGSVGGRIIDVKSDALLLADRDKVTAISLANITYIRSPRAFVFTISGKPSADHTRTRVQSVVFRPTSAATSLTEEVVAGKQKDPLLDDLDDVPITPIRSPAFGRGGRPFSNWP